MAKSKRKQKPAKHKRAARKVPVKKKHKKPFRKPVRKLVRKPAAKRFTAKKISGKKRVAKKLVAKKIRPQAKPIGGLPGELHAAAMKVLKERQAEEIVSINLAGRSSMADYLIIASGRASRQIAAIADHLRKAFADLGANPIRVEGKSQANWVLVDCGDVIVHLFRPEVRRYYGLDKIWEK